MSKPLYSSLGESPLADKRLPDGETVAPPLFTGGCWGSRTFAKHAKNGPRFKCRHRSRGGKLCCAAHANLEQAAQELRKKLEGKG